MSDFSDSKELWNLTQHIATKTLFHELNEPFDEAIITNVGGTIIWEASNNMLWEAGNTIIWDSTPD